jgi:hypothetical protein
VAIGARDYEELKPHKAVHSPIDSSPEDLLLNWQDHIKAVAYGTNVVLVRFPDRSSGGETRVYLISLDQAAAIQAARHNLHSAINKLTGYQAAAPVAPTEMTLTPSAATVSAPDYKIVSISTIEFIQKRATLMAPRGRAQLRADRPTLTITKWDHPRFVAFLPSFIADHSFEEIMAHYLRAADLTGEGSSAFTEFIMAYKAMVGGGPKIPKGIALKSSLSDINSTAGFAILEKSSSSGRPLILTQLKSQGDEPEIILFPVP